MIEVEETQSMTSLQIKNTYHINKQSVKDKKNYKLNFIINYREFVNIGRNIGIKLK